MPIATESCCRCNQRIKDFRAPDGGMTAGYYIAKAWQRFCNLGEEIVCDACMFVDERYISLYGHHNIT